MGGIVGDAGDGSGTLYLSNAQMSLVWGDAVLEKSGTGTWRMEEVNSTITNFDANHGWAYLTSGTPSISLSGHDIKVDLGANAGSPPARLVPLAGDIIWNTNATGTGLYGYTAAGAWKAIF